MKRSHIYWLLLGNLYLMALQTVQMLARMTGFRLRKTEFDSQGWEIAASLQYQADIALRDVRSFAQNGASAMFSAERMQAFEAQTMALNQAADAGRACFYLEKM